MAVGPPRPHPDERGDGRERGPAMASRPRRSSASSAADGTSQVLVPKLTITAATKAKTPASSRRTTPTTWMATGSRAAGIHDHDRGLQRLLRGRQGAAAGPVGRRRGPHEGSSRQQTGKGFGDSANPLLVSVRSGAAFSMPGMMDTVLNLGLNPETVAGADRADRQRALRAGTPGAASWRCSGASCSTCRPRTSTSPSRSSRRRPRPSSTPI